MISNISCFPATVAFRCRDHPGNPFTRHSRYWQLARRVNRQQEHLIRQVETGRKSLRKVARPGKEVRLKNDRAFPAREQLFRSRDQGPEFFRMMRIIVDVDPARFFDDILKSSPDTPEGGYSRR